MKNIDHKIINFSQNAFIPFARFTIFIIFFWFGILKVLGFSPANPLVEALLQQTLPFLTFQQFIVAFGLFEMLIGISFLIPMFTRVTIALLAFHMVTTFMPLILLPQVTWQQFLVPTLEGQYIIKNFALIATAIGIASQLKPFKSTQE